jgi:hypothetical protein
MIEHVLKDASNQCIKIIIEYLNRGLFVKNNKLFAFYILKGYDMLITIFSIVMYQTKNMDIAFYKCQKASHLYIEYIEQISDEQNIYLNLTSRDALLYVYKQTIFDELDLNKTCDPLDSDNNHMIFESIYAYTGIYKKILEIYLKSLGNNNSNQMTIQQIKTLYENVHIHEMDTLEVLDKILDVFYSSEVNIELFFDIFKTLLKKINQPNILLKIKKKLYTENITNNWLISDWINE